MPSKVPPSENPHDHSQEDANSQTSNAQTEPDILKSLVSATKKMKEDWPKIHWDLTFICITLGGIASLILGGTALQEEISLTLQGKPLEITQIVQVTKNQQNLFLFSCMTAPLIFASIIITFIFCPYIRQKQFSKQTFCPRISASAIILLFALLTASLPVLNILLHTLSIIMNNNIHLAPPLLYNIYKSMLHHEDSSFFELLSKLHGPLQEVALGMIVFVSLVMGVVVLILFVSYYGPWNFFLALLTGSVLAWLSLYKIVPHIPYAEFSSFVKRPKQTPNTSPIPSENAQEQSGPQEKQEKSRKPRSKNRRSVAKHRHKRRG